MQESKYVPWIRELCATQMNHWAFFPLALLAHFMIYNLGQQMGIFAPGWIFDVSLFILDWAICSLVPLYFYWVRVRFRGFLSFSLLHALPLSGWLLLFVSGDPVRMSICLATAFLYDINSYSRRLRCESMQIGELHPAVMVALSVFSMFVLHSQEQLCFDGWLFTALILAFGYYSLLYYIDRYRYFLVVNGSSASYIPAKEMFRSGMGMALFFAILSMFLLWIVSHLSFLNVLMDSFHKLLSTIFGMIARLFPQSDDADTAPFQSVSSTEPDLSELLGTGTNDPSPFWILMEYIGFLAVMLAVLLFLVWSLRTLIRFLREQFQKRFSERLSKTPDNACMDIRERCEITRDHKTGSSFSLRKRRSAQQRIRHLYRQKLSTQLNTYEEKTAINALTPRESRHYFGDQSAIDLYEKARYSPYECTQSDVSAMRRACLKKE